MQLRLYRLGGARSSYLYAAYLYAAYVYAAEGSMSEWLDGDGEEDTTEGLFVVLRILFVLRVGVCMGLDA